MIAHVASWYFPLDNEALEILRWYTFKPEPIISFETKTLIIAGISEQDTALGSCLLQSQKTFSNECATNPFTLPARLDRDGAKPVPATIGTIDEYGRKSHVTEKKAFLLCYQ